MINWVLVFGVVCLGTSLFLTWHSRYKARQQVIEAMALYRKHIAEENDHESE